jgi:tetratricopeptide (TPR) repeat protein
MADPGAFLDLLARAELRSAAGDWAEAAGLWDQVTAANPVHGDYWARLAEARFAAADFAAAAVAYTKVLELGVRPDYQVRFRADAPDFLPGEVAYLIACCQARLGRRAEAIDALAVAVGRGFRDLDRARADDCWQAWRDDERLRDLLGVVEVEGLSRDEGWRADLRLLARELKRRAYAPFALISEEEFDREVARLDGSIPSLTDTQIIVAMMRLTAHLDDGHAGIRMPDGDNELSRLVQLEYFLFAEGLFVTAAGPGYSRLLGAEVETIGGRTVDEAVAALEPLIARDNDQQVRLAIPRLLRETAILHGLGLTGDLGQVRMTVRFPDGTSGEEAVDAVPGRFRWDRHPPGWTRLTDTVAERLSGLSGAPPLHLRHRELPYWFEYLPEADLVYFQYNAVADHPAEPFAAFCDRLFAFIADRRPGRLVIDLRWNGGGNTFLAQSLLHHLIRCPRISRRGALFVIIGRLTFSAAQNTATAIGRETEPIFVGEPTGSRPNFTGETIPFELPYSKLRANAGDLFWQTSWPEDHRTWIAPDIFAPPTFEAFRRNDDPALDAILALREHLPGR